MSDTQLIQTSWSDVKKTVGLQDTGLELFVRMFLKSSEIASLFKFSGAELTSDKLRASPRLRKHSLNVMDTIDTAIGKLGDAVGLSPLLEELGRKHAHYYLQLYHFKVLQEALLETLCFALGESAFTSEHRRAWQNLIDVITATMTRGYELEMKQNPPKFVVRRRQIACVSIATATVAALVALGVFVYKRK